MSFTLSPTSISNFSPTPSTPSRFPSPALTPSPSSPSSQNGLLIPTDRPLEELETKWLRKLGNLKVEKEVRLQGYALYSLRSWFLSRTHFSHTIVTQTGKPTEQISAYLLVPAPTLSQQEGAFEIINAIRFLAAETQSTARRTEYGTLLVTTPAAFGQEVNPVPGGDFRAAKPYITVNTGLRRLGCGGRAVIGMESPIPALRRKFHDLYRIPQPAHSTVPLSRNTSNICCLSWLREVTNFNFYSQLPKDPFTSIKRFLNTWAAYQTCTATSLDMPHYLTIHSIRSLAQHYLADRTRHPGDALKVHKLLLNGVAQATSSISANLKGGTTEDTPIRKREHHLRFKGDDENDGEGVGLIIPEGEVGPVAPPDVITTDLEAYIKGILRSREKDWDIMGARRVAELWNGTVAEGLENDKPKRKGRMGSMNSSTGSMRDPNRGVLKKRTQSRDFNPYGNNAGIKEDDEGDNIKDAIKEISGRAGQAIKGGFGLVSRRGTTYDTSDSETGGPGPTTLKSSIMRKRQSTVPLLIEPDLEEVDEQLDRGQSASPSPSTSTRPLDRSWNTSSRPSFLTATSRAQSKRPSIITQVSGNESDIWSRASLAAGLSPTDERSDMEFSNRNSPVGGHSRTPSGQLASNGDTRPAIIRTLSDRALAWRNRGRATAMLRTASDGADVCIEETGMEWEVMNPHGTGKRSGEDLGEKVLELTRRHSLEQVDFYKDMRRVEPEHLQIDVEMCAVVLDLRERERQLAQRAKDVKLFEESVFQTLSQFVTALKSRRSYVDQLSSTSSAIRTQIEALDVDDEHDHENSPRDRFHYYLSEETHRPELLDDLSRLKEMWEGIRKEQEGKRKIAESDDSLTKLGIGRTGKGRWWSWF
ncbi:hypothetical protein V865_005626 [Kwoniella europaea PYCC6329]|uniref:STB6-like N-terminal domain-containing protein n=1 Tax=Kwoniella europaea PYCC6329 TaxID=1423913 RepID=A0AAX4KPJ6_9TREE